MSYENAPATEMLATNCACCGRPLVDAKSVETGVGPDCRKKYGYADDVSADAAAVVRAIALLSAVAAGSICSKLEAGDIRGAVNAMVYAIAQRESGTDHGPIFVGRCIEAIGLLGFVRLATKLTHRLASVHLEMVDGAIVVKAPYSEDATIALRAVPGRRYDAALKANRFPETSKRELFTALRRAYPNAIAFGPKGFFLLAA